MKEDKVTIIFLVAVIAAYFVGENIIYGRVKKLIKVVSQLTLNIQQQSIQVREITGQNIKKQKELDVVKSDLDNLKKDLESLKAKPSAK